MALRKFGKTPVLTSAPPKGTLGKRLTANLKKLKNFPKGGKRK